jgi:hypothetical protein
MSSLRANNFDKLLDIFSEVKNLVKKCDYALRSAISKISRKMWRLTNWQASNEMYWEYLSYAATRLNILCNSRIDEKIKAIILKIYNKIVAILPDTFQLLLFAQELDFPWIFKVDPQSWGKYGIRYTPNKIWDNLAKYIYSLKSKSKPAIIAESEYTQISLNLR